VSLHLCLIKHRILLVVVALTLSGAGLVAQSAMPFVNAPLVPSSAEPGGAGFALTVNGTGFVAGSVVNWNNSARATTFVNGSQLIAAILASDIATAGTVSVTVSNGAHGGGFRTWAISRSRFHPRN